MGIKEEITKIAVEQGYEGAKPKSIAQAIDALTDTLAGEDVKSGRSVVDAIRKYAPYVGGGGGFEPKGAWTIDSGQGDINITAIAVNLNDPRSAETNSVRIYDNVLQSTSGYAGGYAGPGAVACGLYVSLTVEAPSLDVANRLTVVRHDVSTEELPNVEKRVQGISVYFTFQVPEDAPAIGESLAVTTLNDEVE